MVCWRLVCVCLVFVGNYDAAPPRCAHGGLAGGGRACVLVFDEFPPFLWTAFYGVLIDDCPKFDRRPIVDYLKRCVFGVSAARLQEKRSAHRIEQKKPYG